MLGVVSCLLSDGSEIRSKDVPKHAFTTATFELIGEGTVVFVSSGRAVRPVDTGVFADVFVR